MRSPISTPPPLPDCCPNMVGPPQFTAYCARPITGCDPIKVIEYYQRVGHRLNAVGIRVLVPTCGKDAACVCTDHAIKERDKWMVQNSQIVFVNLIGTLSISIGSVMELAWADAFGIHSVVVLDDPNVHQHCFVRDCADIIFATEEKALFYLEKLASGVFC